MTEAKKTANLPAVKEWHQVALDVVNFDDKGAPVLDTLKKSHAYAAYLIHSNLVPATFKTASQVVIGLQFLRELGLQSGLSGLRQVYVVNNVPSLWGDLPLALCYSSGKLDYIKEELIEDDKGGMVAIARGRRKGHDFETSERFSKDDAIFAGLWGQNVWAKYPKDMIRYKARTRLLKTLCADVLSGIAIAEFDFDHIPGKEGSVPKLYGPAKAEKSDLNDRLSKVPDEIEDAEFSEPPPIPTDEEPKAEVFSKPFPFPEDIGEYRLSKGDFAGRTISSLSNAELAKFNLDLREEVNKRPSVAGEELIKRVSIYVLDKL